MTDIMKAVDLAIKWVLYDGVNCKIHGHKGWCVHRIQFKFWLGLAVGTAIYAGVFLS